MQFCLFLHVGNGEYLFIFFIMVNVLSSKQSLNKIPKQPWDWGSYQDFLARYRHSTFMV